MFLRFTAISMLLILTACTPKPAPTLNLTYTPAARGELKSSITVALVKPSISGAPASDSSDREPGPADMIPQKYNTDYALRLQNSMMVDIEKILKAKGFVVTQQVDSIDQIPVGERQKFDLIVSPSFDLGPVVTNNQTTYRYPTGTVLTTNEGSIELSGGISVEYVDPRSKKSIATNTVDVSYLRFNRVDYENQKEAEERFIEFLNDSYPRLMSRLEKKINPTELQSALDTIKRREEQKP